MRLAELEHRNRKLEEAERASEERLAAASKEATAKVGHLQCIGTPVWSYLTTLHAPMQFCPSRVVQCSFLSTAPGESISQDVIDAT